MRKEQPHNKWTKYIIKHFTKINTFIHIKYAQSQLFGKITKSRRLRIYCETLQKQELLSSVMKMPVALQWRQFDRIDQTYKCIYFLIQQSQLQGIYPMESCPHLTYVHGHPSQPSSCKKRLETTQFPSLSLRLYERWPSLWWNTMQMGKRSGRVKNGSY